MSWPLVYCALGNVWLSKDCRPCDCNGLGQSTCDINHRAKQPTWEYANCSPETLTRSSLIVSMICAGACHSICGLSPLSMRLCRYSRLSNRLQCTCLFLWSRESICGLSLLKLDSVPHMITVAGHDCSTWCAKSYVTYVSCASIKECTGSNWWTRSYGFFCWTIPV